MSSWWWVERNKTVYKGGETYSVSIDPSQWDLSVVITGGYHWRLAPPQMCSRWSQLLAFQAADWKHSSTCPAVCILHLLAPTEINECTLPGRVLPPGPQSVGACAVLLLNAWNAQAVTASWVMGKGKMSSGSRLCRMVTARMVGPHPWDVGAQTLQAWASSFPPHTFACFLCELGHSDQLIPLTKGVN